MLLEDKNDFHSRYTEATDDCFKYNQNKLISYDQPHKGKRNKGHKIQAIDQDRHFDSRYN